MTIKFRSVKYLEQTLDGSIETYSPYFFALYRCRIDEESGIREYREQLREQYPEKAIKVGNHFVLEGQPAYLALCAYYAACADADTLDDEFREYMRERLAEVKVRHERSQSLPIPIDLTEGQLANDERLELLTCLSIQTGLVVESDDYE